MIFTFYSFKGGVGRSMAVAGIANLLAREGLRVLAVDFDLEAPGLERYFFDADESRRVREGPGLIDLLLTYKRALTNAAAFEKAEFKNWRSFVTEAIPRASDKGGLVDIITSGRREPQERLREYALAVRTFDWQDFFDNWKGEGFFEWLRRQLVGKAPGYDVVLVDSRTGVTEMGGICAYQLADVAVMLCAANYQNLDGTVAVANDFRSDAVLALRRGRPLELLVVPARLEDNNPGREEFLRHFEEIFASSGMPKALADCGLDYRKLALPYNSEFAVGERLVGDDTSPDDAAGPPGSVRATHLVATFERLADALTLLAPRDSRLGELRDSAMRRLTGTGEVAGQTLIADPTQGSAGYDVFFDASTEDASRANELAERLEQAGFRVFLPPSPESGDSGRNPAIERALDYSETVVVCFGASTRSSWREELIQRARARRRRVVAVVLERHEWLDSALRSFGLDSAMTFDLSEWPADSEFGKLISSLQTPRRPAAFDHAGTEQIPYPGARAFVEDDAGVFFGRESEIDRVIAALDRQNIVVLIGASGVGKTSLLRAGVTAHLASEKDVLGPGGPWVVTYVDMSLGKSHRTALPDTSDRSRRRLIVLDSVDAFPDDGSVQARSLRFEEVRSMLAEAATTRKFVVVLRGAFSAEEWARTLPDRSSATADVALDPMDAIHIQEAIERPAGKFGHLLEPGLVARLIEDAGPSPSAVAKVELVLPELWKARRRGWLTNKAYDDLGKIAGAFDAARTRVLSQALDADSQIAARILFRNLMQLDSALQLAPVPRPWAMLASVRGIQHPDAVALRDRLAAQGLIDVWREREALFVALARPDAARYIGAEAGVPDPEFFLWRARFSLLVQNWIARPGSRDCLAVGDALDEAEAKLGEYANELTADERDFVAASLKARSEREAAERKLVQDRFDHERKRKRVFAATSILAFLMGVIAAGLYFYSDDQAHGETRRAGLAVVNTMSNADPTTAAMAVIEVWERSNTDRSLLEHVTHGFATLCPEKAGFWPCHRSSLSHTDQGFIEAIVRVDDSPLYRAKLTHADAVNDVTFSKDGQTIATASSDGTARLWDRNGKLQKTLAGHEDLVLSVAFSPDGKTVLTTSLDGTARLWDRNGNMLAKLQHLQGEAHAGCREPDRTPSSPSTDSLQSIFPGRRGNSIAVFRGAFAPDGKAVMTASSDCTVRIWDLEGKALAALPHDAKVRHAAFVPDLHGGDHGRATIVTASDDHSARIWDLQGNLLAILPHEDGVIFAEADPAGEWVVTTSADATAALWDIEAARLALQTRRVATPLAKFKGHGDDVLYAAFSPDRSSIVTGSKDGTARLWDRDGTLRKTMSGHSDIVNRVAFSPDNRMILTASGDGTVGMWDRQGKRIALLKGHTGSVRHVAISSDATSIVTLSVDRTARLWDRSGKPLLELVGHKNAVSSAAISPDGKTIATVSDDNTARLWSQQGKLVATTPALPAAMMSAAFDPSGTKIATASLDSTARVWDLQGRELVSLNGHTKPVLFAAFSPRGTAIVTTSVDTTARVWDLAGNQLALLSGHTGAVGRASFSPDGGLIATASFDNTARLWTSDGKLLTVLKKERVASVPSEKESIPSALPAFMTFVEFSPDGQTIVTGSSDGTAQLWDLKGKLLREFAGHSGLLYRAIFDPLGTTIATASNDGTAKLWNLDGSELATLAGHAGPVTDLQFSPDGQTIVTASEDSTARVWNRQGVRLATLNGHGGAVRYAGFTPDGQTIVTTSSDATARLWPIGPASFVERVHAISVTCLVDDERRTIFPKGSADDLRSACGTQPAEARKQ